MFLLSGCASTIHNIKPNYSLDPSSDKSIVFGKTSFDLGMLGGQYYVRFKNVETGRYYEIFARDGKLMIFRKKKEPFNGFVEKEFFLELPPGEYYVKQISITDAQMYALTYNPEVEFSVPSNSIVYVGTLRYAFEQEHDYYFVRTGKTQLWVLDEHEDAISKLRREYPYLEGDVKVALMKLADKKAKTSKDLLSSTVNR